MAAPKRDVRALLATGGLLLIPLAALWLVLSPRLSRHPGPPSPPAGGSGTPREVVMPAARVAAGDLTQGEWTLLAVTALDPRPGLAVEALPPNLALPAGGLPGAWYPDGAGVGTGLWIGVRGGLVTRTLAIPKDGKRHVYPFGRAALAMNISPQGSGLSGGWEGTGRERSPQEMPPFYWFVSPGPSPSGQPDALTLRLAPNPLSTQVRVTAQPLAADGRPTGRAVGLACHPVTADVLFAQIPAGYNSATRQFQVTVTRVGVQTKTGAASWRLTDLPPSFRHGPDSLPPVVAARLGPFDLRAEAAEAPDTSGGTGFTFSLSGRSPAPSLRPQNFDGHQWTGVPTLRYRLSIRRQSPLPPGQSWAFRLEQVVPQWTAEPIAPMVPDMTVPGQSPNYLPFRTTPAGVQGWLLQDGEAGAAYPGQQRWITLAGTAFRYVERTETVTFHDADVVHDASFGGDRVFWRHPETQTSPSGVTVTVLNGRAGKRDTDFGRPGGPSWWYDRGNAELLLAWRLPPRFVSAQGAAPDAPRVVQPPHGTGPLLAVQDTLRPDAFVGRVAPPGATDARPLMRAGFRFLRLSVSAPGKSLPRRLPTLTLQIALHEEQEQHRIQLVVPVRPGNNPRL